MPRINLTDNCAELDADTMGKLCAQLSEGDAWRAMIEALPTAEAFTDTEMTCINRSTNSAQATVVQLGNRGLTVLQLIQLADRCRLVAPQLVLRRKFAPIRVKRGATTMQTTDNCVTLSCSAIGFPYPHFAWLCNEEEVNVNTPSTSNACLALIRCEKCSPSGTYKCRVSNRIEENVHWPHYRDRGLQTESTACSDELIVDLTNELCQPCRSSHILQRVGELGLDNGVAPPTVRPDDQDSTSYVAVDKVALIVANGEYEHLTPLRTPPCDAQTIAAGLLEIGFKTVTLADLTKQEMLRLLAEYDKLLGTEGVYAVFYFVGHGFEVNGQCFLLPVDAPGDNEYTPDDCIAVDAVLATMQTHRPALNLILLDMCRKPPPRSFVGVAPRHTSVNRNTVFGYATSTGVGAYEVRGESNGIFMKYLKEHLFTQKSVITALNAVLRDLERDPTAAPVQFPELRTNLSRPLSLADPVVFTGHTCSFDARTAHWQAIHELPEPNHVTFSDAGLLVTVWFDYCGHYCNMAFAFSSVSTIEGEQCAVDVVNARAYITFDAPIESGESEMCDEAEEGVSVRMLVKNLQKVKNLRCHIDVHDGEHRSICRRSVDVNSVLIMRL